jgi:hypothetical protein
MIECTMIRDWAHDEMSFIHATMTHQTRFWIHSRFVESIRLYINAGGKFNHFCIFLLLISRQFDHDISHLDCASTEVKFYCSLMGPSFYPDLWLLLIYTVFTHTNQTLLILLSVFSHKGWLYGTKTQQPLFPLKNVPPPSPTELCAINHRPKYEWTGLGMWAAQCYT